MTQVQVENIIVSFSVASALDLPKLAEILPDARYDPCDTPALILQFPHPHAMAALSPSGTAMVTGPKTMDEVHEVMKMVQDRLNIAGVEVDWSPQLLVENVTVSTDVHQEIKLRSLAKFLQVPEFSPRTFPGLVYKGDDPNTVILLFDSGKMVCNGKSVEDATVALKKMMEKLVSFGIKMEENVCQK
jgi:transcription initiation factor TFIID TATA-box-binding protein